MLTSQCLQAETAVQVVPRDSLVTSHSARVAMVVRIIHRKYEVVAEILDRDSS